MPKLPIVCIDLIYYYLGLFTVAENRPKLSAIRRLIHRSDNFLQNRVFQWFYNQYGTLFPLHPWLLLDSLLLQEIMKAAVRDCRSSNYLIWLFITREPNLYFPPYSDLFNRSILSNMLKKIHNGRNIQ